MSMPIIRTSDDPVTPCQAVTDLLESIALEETALSHILNAEGEKLQRVIGFECVDFCQLMEVNESVANMVAVVSGLEQALKDKLEFITANLYYPCNPCNPCDPCDPCCPCKSCCCDSCGSNNA